MGVTNHTADIVSRYIQGATTFADLGDQMYYGNSLLPYGDYYSKWVQSKGITYTSYDLNGLNNSVKLDFSIAHKLPPADIVLDAGFSEHVEDYYNCWLNKWNLCKVGGVIISENPKRGNWPGHGFNYITKGLYNILCFHADANIVEYGEHPAMGNVTDGWNVWCVLRKYGTRFPSREEFEKLPVYGS